MRRTSFALLLSALVVTVGLVVGGSSDAFAGVQITIVNVNAAGVGFNDPTPAAPVGGNAGHHGGPATAHRLPERRGHLGSGAGQHGGDPDSVLLRAAGLYRHGGDAGLGRSDSRWSLNFPGPGSWTRCYHTALANKLAREDLIPAPRHHRR